MDIQHLKENLIALIKDVNSVRPKRDGKFITRVLLKSFPSQEQLKIDPFLFIPEQILSKGNNLKTNKSKTDDVVEENENEDEDNFKQQANVN